MVLAKEQVNASASSGDRNPSRMSSTASNEQPVSKRQRIDAVDLDQKGTNTTKSAIKQHFTAVAGVTADKPHKSNGRAPPDILSTSVVPAVDDLSANIGSINRPIVACSIGGHQLRWNSTKARDDVDNAAAATGVILCAAGEPNGLLRIQHEYPDLLQTGNSYPSSASSTSSNSPSSIIKLSTSPISNTQNGDVSNIDEFQVYLMKQCLCGISEKTLRRPFESHYHKDINGIRHVVVLNEWPVDKLIQFLSNVQLLFDVYLKQNAKGKICTRIMEVCDALIHNEHNVIDEIFHLYEYNNKFVQFLAGRLVASCMVIAKDKREIYESWLTTLVVNLTSDNGDYAALRRINFSLESILRILEWRDIEEHPLEDSVVIDGRAIGSAIDSEEETFTLPLMVPPIENNYFALQFNADYGPSLLSSASLNQYQNGNDDRSAGTRQATESTTTNDMTSCHLQNLDDSESFDTTDLKCNIVCAMKTKWSHLVDSMANRTIQLNAATRYDEYVEHTILTFLSLWERIISVQANLSVDSTLPFHEKLTVFENILISGNLPVSIYKQILTLFNESLCYGTTLALQSVLPEETNKLANEIFNSVKSQRIFNSLPKVAAEPENDIGFIGYKRPTLAYSVDTAATPTIEHDSSFPLPTFSGQHQGDNTQLQKLVLLILKSIAVTVKPVRGDDSSDSSMDGCSSTSSTEFEAYQATIQIERATRDVLKKLNQFMKNKLDHHPETHFSKMVVHLFADQDDYLIEAMVCMLDTTTAFLPRQPFGSANLRPNRNQFRALIDMLSPVYSFLEFLELISNKTELLLDLLVSNETCFLLYLLRFLKYIRSDWTTFRDRCNDWMAAGGQSNHSTGALLVDDTMPNLAMSILDRAMSVLIRLRMQIERLVMQSLYPYDITPIIDLLHQCENLYEGNDNELF